MEMPSRSPCHSAHGHKGGEQQPDGKHADGEWVLAPHALRQEGVERKQSHLQGLMACQKLAQALVLPKSHSQSSHGESELTFESLLPVLDAISMEYAAVARSAENWSPRGNIERIC